MNLFEYSKAILKASWVAFKQHPFLFSWRMFLVIPLWVLYIPAVFYIEFYDNLNLDKISPTPWNKQ